MMMNKSLIEKPHASALRRGRNSIAGQVYHLCTNTVEREPVFSDLFSARIVVQSLSFLHERGDVTSLAYVLMPDHLHWLVELGEKASLESLMHNFKSYTAIKINKHLERTGASLWQKGYFDYALRADEDVKKVAHYIIANPIRSGLCKSIYGYSHWDAIWIP
jgi:REP element-mobilizing transposase RayT